MQISEAQYFFFDMDGLIFDTERVAVNLIMQNSFKRGYHVPLAVYQQCTGCNYEEILKIVHREVGEDYPYPEIWLESQKEMDQMALSGTMPLKEGAYVLIRHLKELNKCLWLVSSSPIRVCKLLLEHANLLDCFSGFTTGDQVAKSKPAPDIYLEAIRQSGATPRASFAFEDSINGAQSAISAGLATVIVPDSLPPPPELQAQAYRVLKSLSEFEEEINSQLAQN